MSNLIKDLDLFQSSVIQNMGAWHEEESMIMS